MNKTLRPVKEFSLSKYKNVYSAANLGNEPLKQFASFDFGEIVKRYGEGNRFYHTLEHVDRILGLMESSSHVYDLTPEENLIIRLVAFYHDIVYDPLAKDNELNSAEIFRERFANETRISQKVKDRVYDIILSTDMSNPVTSCTLEYYFRYLDTYDLIERPAGWEMTLIKNEKNIQKEFQFVDWKTYVEHKKLFLKRLKRLDPSYVINSNFLESYIDNVTPNIAIFAGSFSNFHIGHLSILREAERKFDKVILAVGVNPSKPNAKEDQFRRYNNLKRLMKYHQVDMYDGLLTDYIQGLGYPVTLVRGLRTDTDFKAEEVQYRVMQDIYPDLNVVFILSEKKYEHVSSSMVKALDQFNKELGQNLYLLNTEEVYNLND
jgi:pantetheine-phosphate adenylyltransferase